MSLEGTLFINSWKNFVDGNLEESEKMYSLLTFDFPQVDMMLRHQRIQELINFLIHIKTKAATFEIQEKKINQINELLSRIQKNLTEKEGHKHDKLISQGKRLVENKLQKQALLKFQESLKIKPTEEACIYIAIIELHHNNNLKEFIQNINKALSFEENKNNLSLYEMALENLSKQQDNIVKFKCAKRVISLGSKNPKFYLQFVEVGLKVNQSLSSYINIIDSSCPKSIEKYYSLGIIYFTLDRYQKCLNNLETAEREIKNLLYQKKVYQMTIAKVKIPPKLPQFNKVEQFYCFLGKAYQKFDLKNEAIEAFQKALTHNNRSIEVWKQIFKIFQGKPHYQSQQLDLIESMIIITEDDYEVHTMIVDLFSDIGEGEVLVLFAESLITLYQNNDKYLYLAAKSYLKVRDYAKARQLCDKTIKINAKNEQIYLIYGLICYHEQKYEQAKESYKKATQLNPKQYLAYFNLALILYNSTEYVQAKQACESAIKINPNFLDSYHLLIKSMLKSGDHNNQIEDLSQDYLARSNQNSEAIFCLAEIKFSSQKYKQALEYYEKVIRKEPNHYESIYKKALIDIIQQNNMKSAHQQVKRLIELEKKIQYISLQAYILIKDKQNAQAYRILVQSINKYRTYYQIYYHLGYLLRNDQQILQANVQQVQELLQSKSFDQHTEYYLSLMNLALGRYQDFLEKFNNYIYQYKTTIIKNPKNNKKIKQIYRNIICHFEQLMKLYHNQVDIYIILGILYSDIDNQAKSLQYCKKLIEDKQPLSSNFIPFYNSNHKYHEHISYLKYVYQYIFHQIFQYSTLEGMKFYKYLIQVKFVFKDSEAINYEINKRKEKLAENTLVLVVEIIKEILNSKNRKTNQIKEYLNDLVILLNEKDNKNIINLTKLQDIFDIIKQDQQMAIQQSFFSIKQSQSFVASSISKGFSQELLYQLVRYLVVKYYYVQLYPFVYQNEQKTILEEISRKFPSYSQTQLIIDNINKLKMLVKQKFLKNEANRIKINEQLSSKILFDKFQNQEDFAPLIQPKKKYFERQKNHFQASPHTQRKKAIKTQHLNSFQRQIMKSRLKHQSLIEFSKKSSISLPPSSSSIFIIDNQQWPQ